MLTGQMQTQVVVVVVVRSTKRQIKIAPRPFPSNSARCHNTPTIPTYVCYSRRCAIELLPTVPHEDARLLSSLCCGAAYRRERGRDPWNLGGYERVFFPVQWRWWPDGPQQKKTKGIPLQGSASSGTDHLLHVDSALGTLFIIPCPKNRRGLDWTWPQVISPIFVIGGFSLMSSLIDIMRWVFVDRFDDEHPVGTRRPLQRMRHIMCAAFIALTITVTVGLNSDDPSSLCWRAYLVPWYVWAGAHCISTWGQGTPDWALARCTPSFFKGLAVCS
ncbi:transmembrane protein, putative [Bodo saltans]|uniref:Transmembrane protein, putative n=1 Tax=Bodo saltans TaxID=75058 RepID=A0A0S4ILS2_BODSA|nr:transmembrane protein, putative [Bodo saltans]|eukprot:CUE70485.1 transmembrane protein, putative [Bodo saltans]